ncbi:MAG: PEGA domain-containing protein, partial [Deltaproteobacteria bacterium]|nr:PEGA domain-containing protein [Deltaproteobacteria bacterium]
PPVPVTQKALRIESTPPGAKIFIDEAETDWKTPYEIENLSPQAHKIGLNLDGYRFWEQTVTLKKGEKKELQAKLEINYGGLSVRTIPEGATVMLNNVEVGKTPWINDRLLPEALFSIKLMLDGYEEVIKEAKIFSGRQTVINASLKKKALAPPP